MQSSAIAALIVRGDLRPDLGVIVDTERELSTTWEYHDSVIVPALASVGFPLHRVCKSKYATVDLYRNEDLLIPAFTETGKLPTFCSNEWKQRTMRRWAAREHNVRAADVWLGISTDELRRVKQPLGKWQNRYPLIERRMSRSDCITLVESMGWPTPPRSSCWMCSNHSKKEWADQKARGGEDWDRAVKLEAYLRTKDDEIYLAASGKKLEEIDFENGNGDLLTGLCDSGYCFT